MSDNYYITAVYEASEKYKLVEQYGPDSFTVMEDGRLWTRWGFTDTEWALEWFLSFGNKAKVLSPPEMVEQMKKAVASLKNIYEI